MKLWMAVLTLALLTCGCSTSVRAEPPAPKSLDLTPDSSVDDILDALDALGEGLKDFTAEVKMTTEDGATGLGSTRSGVVWFQNQGEGDSRLRVTFDTKEEDGPEKQEKIEYMLDDGWLVDRDYKKKIEVKRQVLRPGEKINLLKLGEGPFPLPIGQDKADAHKLFEITKVAASKDDPDDTVHLELKPTKGSQFERKFHAIDVWVDLKSHMPRRIGTSNVPQTEIRVTDLSNVRVNPGLNDEDFALPAISEKEWTQHTEPYEG
jgi:outer membrane lipoprotein-sorting protein